jgi:hypothetical protein
MVELALLALLNRLMDWGLAPLIATRTVAADADALHRFLSDPANELRLLGRRPRDAAAHVRPSASRRVVSVELLRGGRPALLTTWILTAGRGTTEVDLAVQFQTRGIATRLALALGGRRWLAREVEAALGRLARTCARAAEDVDERGGHAISACGRGRAARHGSRAAARRARARSARR